MTVNPFKEILEGNLSNQIHSLNPDICSFEDASQRVADWQAAGHYVVFNAGAYDILTVNHVLNLVQCRALGAMGLLGIDTIETDQERDKVHELAASDDITLIVTLDTNVALREGKSRCPEKGGALKPTLDWNTRATMLAMQTIPAPNYSSSHRAVDYVTRHGPECCAACPSGTCVNEDNAMMAVGLQPDVVVVSAGSERTMSDLRSLQLAGMLPDTLIAVNNETCHQYCDPLLGGPVKTTQIINRIRA
jgi:hypothetical protein